jgi:uncharacterized protein
VAYPKGLPQRWYHRTYDEQEKTYTWSKPSTGFKQDKNLEEKTRSNSLFLSVAAQFNHPQLTPTFNWFQNNIHFNNISGRSSFSPIFTARLLKNPNYYSRILRLLQSADIGICDAEVEEQEIEFDLDKLKRGFLIAVKSAERCRKFHEGCGSSGNPSTDIDGLVRELNKAARIPYFVQLD